MVRIEGRVALVTGASRGIGWAIARRLAAEGAVVLAAARGDHALAVVEAIRAAGGLAEPVTLDVTAAASIDAAVAMALDRFQRIDILVNNAGVTRDQLLLRMRREDWDAVIATNLTAAYCTAQAVLKPMIRQRAGRIINMTSVVGEIGNAGQVNYAASKAGLIGFTKALALEVASRNITVNAVAPGLIDTEMTRAIAVSAHQDLASRIPLKRLGAPDDVANAVLFLASDEASYITGHVLAVNGGMHM
jgi:3-oxoacyl-[acyl-carrier protein] reductase